VSLPIIGPRLLDEMTAIAARACAAILAIAPAAFATRQKLDQSPVTAADEAAEAVILDGLSRLLPGVPVVSEEAAVRPLVLPSTFVLVDALDGTREFIAGRAEFTVNIALVVDGSPIVGLVAGPALHRIWRGIVGQGAERLAPAGEPPKALQPTAIRTRSAPPQGLVAALSRSHGDQETESFLGRLPIVERTTLGSSAKFCLVAEGSADLYPRLSPTSEWDIAAGHAVLAAAGGTVMTPDGGPIMYGGVRRDFRVPAFIAWGDAEAARRYAS
jgi:3'(2'), 5'-bisphosphate nucleotidase